MIYTRQCPAPEEEEERQMLLQHVGHGRRRYGSNEGCSLPSDKHKTKDTEEVGEEHIECILL